MLITSTLLSIANFLIKKSKHWFRSCYTVKTLLMLFPAHNTQAHGRKSLSEKEMEGGEKRSKYRTPCHVNGSMCVESFNQCRARTNCLSKQINLSHSRRTKTHLFTLWQIGEPHELKAPLRSSSHVCTQRRISTVTEVWAKTHSPTHGEPAIKQQVNRRNLLQVRETFQIIFTFKEAKGASKYEQILSYECAFPHFLLTARQLYVK